MSNPKKMIEECRTQIADGKSERVLKNLIDYFKDNQSEQERYSDLLQYSSNLKQQTRKYNMGMLSSDEYAKAQAILSNLLLTFLTEWYDEIKDNKSAKPPRNSFEPPVSSAPPDDIANKSSAGDSPDDNVTTKNVVATLVPPVMQVGTDSECKVFIGVSKDIIAKNISADVVADYDYDVELTKIVSVELKLKGTDQTAFTIVAENNHSQQALQTGRATEWTWMVNPKKAGNFTILIFVSAVFRINGENYPQDIKLEKKVSVTVGSAPDVSPPPPPPMKLNILFLSANPDDTARLHTNSEFDEIVRQKAMAKYRDDLVMLTPVLSAAVEDILFKLINDDPNIVHFAGHGDTEGIILQDKDGNAQPQSKLAGILAQANSLKCLILNACYSQSQAEEIKAKLPDLHIIAMKYAVADDDARTFSIGFYMALGAGRTYLQAFNAGKALVGATTDSNGEDVLILM